MISYIPYNLNEIKLSLLLVTLEKLFHKNIYRLAGSNCSLSTYCFAPKESRFHIVLVVLIIWEVNIYNLYTSLILTTLTRTR